MGGKTDIGRIRRRHVLFVLCPLNIPVQADQDNSSSGMGELCGWREMGKRHRSHAASYLLSEGADREILIRVSPPIQRSSSAVHSNIQSGVCS